MFSEFVGDRTKPEGDALHLRHSENYRHTEFFVHSPIVWNCLVSATWLAAVVSLTGNISVWRWWVIYCIYTAHFIVWQPCRAADTSMNWRHNLFYCCTASMEQATDGAETAAIERTRFVVISKRVSFCLRAPRYGLTLWCTLGLLVGGAIQLPELLLLLLLLLLGFVTLLLYECTLYRHWQRSYNTSFLHSYSVTGMSVF